MHEISENISCLEASEEPLSANVYLIKGNEYIYIVDVGNNDSSFEIISNISKKKIVITHFHPDHAGNIRRTDANDSDIFVGDYTYKYTKRGNIVNEEKRINDGVDIRILPIPNSHAKGSLCVVINDEFLILGDSFYSNVKGYNVSLLHDEMKCLEELTFTKVLMSHDNIVYSREYVLETFRKIFDLRTKNEPFISNELLSEID